MLLELKLDDDRKRAGWSVEQAAGRLGVSDREYREIEAGWRVAVLPTGLLALRARLRQPGFATVSRMAASSNASSVWRASGTMSTVPVRPSQDESPADNRTRPCKTCTVASPGLSCSLWTTPFIIAITV
jgi:hypothetical protein